MNSILGNSLVPRARSSDPSTSHAAAARALKFASSHRGRILTAFRGWANLTANDIAEKSGLTVVQVDRRLVEMQREGLIETTGHTRDGFRCWRLV